MSKDMDQILKMLEEGKITAAEAKQLIEAISKSQNSIIEVKTEKKNYNDRFLKIKMISDDGNKLNFQLPVKTIKAILKISGKLPIQAEGINGIDMADLISTISESFENETVGEILNITSNDGNVIKVVIE
ncbi:hypothetical protein [Clostridium sp. BJN0001]|uniref:SHOCT-like domain-containing protein n=1 Tax=Clostridium sp. BJN0001 TaxID=2930219 RepID=UPI001FD06C49|nr:hypothetical protein [Clostridium sp. BJN0001]